MERKVERKDWDKITDLFLTSRVPYERLTWRDTILSYLSRVVTLVPAEIFEIKFLLLLLLFRRTSTTSGDSVYPNLLIRVDVGGGGWIIGKGPNTNDLLPTISGLKKNWRRRSQSDD